MRPDETECSARQVADDIQALCTLTRMLSTSNTSLQALEDLLKPVHMQVVSQAAAAGRVAVVQSLADIQGQDFPAPTVVIAGKVGGMEDIPVRPFIPDCPPCPYHVGTNPHAWYACTGQQPLCPRALGSETNCTAACFVLKTFSSSHQAVNDACVLLCRRTCRLC